VGPLGWLEVEAMTISKYIRDFISNYLDGVSITTNHLEEGPDNYGLFKSPAREIRKFNDGSCDITEHYQFFAKQDGVSEADRKDSDEFLEELTYWMDDYSLDYTYPPIDGNRVVTDISITGSPYSLDVENDNEVVYQIMLSITYTREREV
jgi:hypothetical protein